MLVLAILWVICAVTFFMPAFRDAKKFGKMGALDNLRKGREILGADLHISTDVHEEIRVRSEVPATPTRTHELTRRAPDGPRAPVTPVTLGYMFDSVGNVWIDADGEVVDASVVEAARHAAVATPTAVAPSASRDTVPMNARAQAYHQLRPASPETNDGYRGGALDTPARRAALRRRKTLQVSGIVTASSTLIAFMTAWSPFMAVAGLSWLFLFIWTGLNINLFLKSEAARQMTPAPAYRPRATIVASDVDSPLPNNVISIRRDSPAASFDDEFFDPSAVGGFGRVSAVGE